MLTKLNFIDEALQVILGKARCSLRSIFGLEATVVDRRSYA